MNLKELMEKSIPRPWHTEGDGQIFGPNPEFDPTDLQTHDEILIADVAHENAALTEYDADNAALIVHCVNNFAQLVEALEEIQKSCPRYSDDEGINAGLLRIMQVTNFALTAAQTIPSGEKGDK